MDDSDSRQFADIPDPFGEGAARSPKPPGMTERSPSRARVHRLRVVAVAVALIAEASWLAFVEHRPDL